MSAENGGPRHGITFMVYLAIVISTLDADLLAMRLYQPRPDRPVPCYVVAKPLPANETQTPLDSIEQKKAAP